MRWSAPRLFGFLGLLACASWAQADEDYGVLIISRERLEVGTPCEIGIYMQDQLVGRLFQEETRSFNLPAGDVSVRLRVLPTQTPGCSPGIEAQNNTRLHINAHDVLKYRIASGPNGMYLKKAELNY
ncbi:MULTISPECIES: hypothetical protein [unclassified Pseudomonas]|uniref:hypothetical protein n=1 Tax=unclassified Pseudomonas TaxID=196821 RepID=UPI000D37F0FB|nr:MULTISPECIES: hypothetical protein [unclassified Pseudomonas]RAU44931.1 hypothetical protein DBP26_015765 [Pseudomonas sp. RIT 409]RAU53495.1 hypothetical protein DBY65_014855 [Pseudomonas sp. RIT 412]